MPKKPKASFIAYGENDHRIVVNGHDVILFNLPRPNRPLEIQPLTRGDLAIDGVIRGHWLRALDGRYVAEIKGVAQHFTWDTPVTAVERLIEKVSRANRL